MNEELKEATVAVLDRMVTCGWGSVGRNASGDVALVADEKGFEIMKALKELFETGDPMTVKEMAVFVVLVNQFDQVR
jgi:hypothetical protein